MKPEEVWQAALGELQLQIPRSTYDTWLRDAILLGHEDGTYVIGVTNAYAKDWLENRLLATVKRTLTGIVEHAVEVRFTVWTATTDAALADSAGAAAVEDVPGIEAASRGAPGGLNPKYTFETFVVSPSNRLAHAAALAAAENPAKAYNPLFLYGGVGLGKTHLLHAVGHIARRRGLSLLYCSSEQFTNDLIEAIKTHATEAFRAKYRTIDVLLIDDIQFIAGKESTQEEFFHTFNELHGHDRQLVISSDRPPKALVTLEERLRSRFEWGLAADIQPPDIETRMAILRFKAESMRRDVPPEVLELIARRIQSNISELEGALNRIIAYADILGLQLTMEVANSALTDFLPRHRTLSPQHIIDAVAEYYNVPVEALTGRDRSKEIALPRQMAMYLVREETDASLLQIGDLLGGRDHTTVMYGCEKIADTLERDDSLRRQVIALREHLYSQVGALA